MSWLRNAVHRAVEAGGGGISLTTRTVRTSLGTVVHHAGQAVVGGARLINGIGNRYYKSLKLTAKRLEEAALSYRGEERVQLLRRWVVGLKETERAASSMREPQRVDDPNQPAPVLDLYVDYETGGVDPMNFFHVFLYSQALECVVLSMAKRDELLQFAQCAISGIKINAEVARLDTEIMQLQQEINAIDAVRANSTRNRNKASPTVPEEDELSRSVASSKVEASTVRAWINFLEDTWKLQSLYEEIKEKQANDELDRCGVCFVNSIKHHVSACVEELSTSIERIKTFVDNLKIFSDRSISVDGGDNGPSKQSNPQKYLEEGYLESEKKVVAAFSLADNIRTLTFSNPERRASAELMLCWDNPEVKDLFATIDKLRVEFESVPRPVLQIEIKEKEERSRRLGSLSFKSSAGTPGHSRTESPIAAQLRTRLPSESDSEPGKLDQDFKEYAADDIGGWEFDELEDELRTGVQ
ncbi:hypothetical protein ACQ4PT_061953 [Festuca glaucescens]